MKDEVRAKNGAVIADNYYERRIAANMDIATLGGIILGVGAVILAFIIEGGNMTSLVHVPAMIIVIFGTVGAATVTTSLNTIKNVPRLIRIAFTSSTSDLIAVIDRIVNLAEKARREGILGLEDNVNKMQNPYFKKAIQLVIDGTDTSLLRNILETEIYYIGQRHKTGIMFFQKLGGFSPTLGIVGTVLGLIHALTGVGSSTQIAGAIAGAFIATLWGISMANLCYLPISDKLRFRHNEESKKLELILEGMISIQSGESPRMIRSKLMSFIHPGSRQD